MLFCISFVNYFQFIMAVPVIYHPYRKFLLKNIIASTAVGFVAAEAYWRLVAVPKVERRNLVMSLIEQDRAQKRAVRSIPISLWILIATCTCVEHCYLSFLFTICAYI